MVSVGCSHHVCDQGEARRKGGGGAGGSPNAACLDGDGDLTGGKAKI